MIQDNEGVREIDCPRCNEQCGWCSDYRWMHGTMRLPNHSGRKNTHCTIPGMEPEGDNCPLCCGSHRVLAVTTYHPLPAQGMEARRAVPNGAVHDSPVRQDAPNTTHSGEQ